MLRAAVIGREELQPVPGEARENCRCSGALPQIRIRVRLTEDGEACGIFGAKRDSPALVPHDKAIGLGSFRDNLEPQDARVILKPCPRGAEGSDHASGNYTARCIQPDQRADLLVGSLVALYGRKRQAVRLGHSEEGRQRCCLGKLAEHHDSRTTSTAVPKIMPIQIGDGRCLPAWFS